MNSCLQYANTKLTSPYYINYSYKIQPKYCEGTLRNFDPIKKLLPVLATLCKVQPSNSCSDRESSVCRGRSHEVHVWQHFRSPLEGLDNGQVGKSGTVSRGDTAACLARDQEFLELFRDLDNRAPDFVFEYRT